MLLTPPISTLFPYTTLFRSEHVFVAVEQRLHQRAKKLAITIGEKPGFDQVDGLAQARVGLIKTTRYIRSEEHTSELQSLRHLVCRLLLEKKKKKKQKKNNTHKKTTKTYRQRNHTKYKQERETVVYKRTGSLTNSNHIMRRKRST